MDTPVGGDGLNVGANSTPASSGATPAVLYKFGGGFSSATTAATPHTSASFGDGTTPPVSATVSPQSLLVDSDRDVSGGRASTSGGRASVSGGRGQGASSVTSSHSRGGASGRGSGGRPVAAAATAVAGSRLRGAEVLAPLAPLRVPPAPRRSFVVGVPVAAQGTVNDQSTEAAAGGGSISVDLHEPRARAQTPAATTTTPCRSDRELQVGRAGLQAAARDALTQWQHTCCCALHCFCHALPDRRVVCSDTGLPPKANESIHAGDASRDAKAASGAGAAPPPGPVDGTLVQVVDNSPTSASKFAALTRDLMACRKALMRFCKGVGRQRASAGAGAGAGAAGAGAGFTPADAGTAGSGGAITGAAHGARIKPPGWAQHGCVLGPAWALRVTGPAGLRVDVVPDYCVAPADGTFTKLVRPEKDPLSVGVWRHMVATEITNMAPPSTPLVVGGNSGRVDSHATALRSSTSAPAPMPLTGSAQATAAAGPGAKTVAALPVSRDADMTLMALPPPQLLVAARKVESLSAPPSILPLWDALRLKPCVAGTGLRGVQAWM